MAREGPVLAEICRVSERPELARRTEPSRGWGERLIRPTASSFAGVPPGMS